MIKEKRRKKRQAKNIVLVLLGILLFLVIAFFVVIKVFVIKNVKVEGNQLYEEQLIKNAVLNDEYSWNSLYVLIKYKFVETDAVPFIDTMEISMNNPQSITIKVYEKGLLGSLYMNTVGEIAYFDKDGIVTETSKRVIENVPEVKGMQCDEIILYEQLPVESQQLRELLTLTQTLKREDLIPDSIQYGIEDAPVLHYGDVEVTMGSMDLLTQKVARLKEILPKVETMVGTLHLENWTEESTNIVFEKEIQEEETEEPSDADDAEDDGDEAQQDENEPQQDESESQQAEDELQQDENGAEQGADSEEGQ